jgi:hypothetical protein
MLSVIEWNEMELAKKRFLLKQSIDKFKLAEQQVNDTLFCRKQLKNKAKIELGKAKEEMINAKNIYNEARYKLEMLKITSS